MHTGKSLNSTELPVFYTVKYMGMRPAWYFHLIHLVIATIWDNHLVRRDQLSKSCVIIYSKIIFTTLLLSPFLQLFDLLSSECHWRPLEEGLRIIKMTRGSHRLCLASRAAQTSTHQLKSAIQSSTHTCRRSTFFSPLWNFPRSPFLMPLFSVLPPCTIAISSWHNWLSSEELTGLFSGLTRMSSWDGFRQRSTEILETA